MNIYPLDITKYPRVCQQSTKLLKLMIELRINEGVQMSRCMSTYLGSFYSGALLSIIAHSKDTSVTKRYIYKPTYRRIYLFKTPAMR